MSDRPLCVYCRQRPVEPRWRPFCSERCKMADLGRWLVGDYRLPSRPDEDEERSSQPSDEDDGDRSH